MTANENLNFKRKELNLFYRFVSWCSGARLYILEQCPSEYNKYYGIGFIVIMTGVMASISGGYALHTIFENVYIAIGFGLLWGTLIFGVDWFIVASLRKEKRFFREFTMALPRLMLAVLIGIVISKPLELKLFEKEINQEIAHMKSEEAIAYQQLVDMEFAEIEVLRKTNEVLQSQIEMKSTQRDQLFTMIIEEAEGRSPTNLVGKGPVYKEKKQEFDKIQKEYNELKETNKRLIAKNEARIDQLQKQRDKKIQSGGKQIEQSGGFLARLEAIDRLSQKEKSIRNANIFIILLFVFVESAPMIVKLMSRRGPYDELVDAIESKKNIAIQKDYIEARADHTNQKKYIEELKTYQANLKFETDKVYIKSLFNAQMDIDQKEIELWRNEEMKKLKKNLPEKFKSIERLVKKDIKPKYL